MDDWRTPPELFAALNHEFGLRLDVAADGQNHLCSHWFSLENSALDKVWDRPWFMNHPYSDSGTWLRKAAFEGERMLGVGLIPYMPSEGWWEYVEKAVEVRRIPHRIKFLLPDGQTKDSARFASAVVVWRPQPGLKGIYGPRYVTWSWR